MLTCWWFTHQVSSLSSKWIHLALGRTSFSHWSKLSWEYDVVPKSEVPQNSFLSIPHQLSLRKSRSNICLHLVKQKVIKQESAHMALFLSRCLDKSVLFPPGFPLWCLNTTNIGVEKGYVIGCCNDRDFCNRDLRPAFAPPTQPPQSSGETEEAGCCCHSWELVWLVLAACEPCVWCWTSVPVTCLMSSA